jgi:hypothetical protein
MEQDQSTKKSFTQRMSRFRTEPAPPGDFLYGLFERPAKVIKSALQMAIGIWALIELIYQFQWSQRHPSCVPQKAPSFCYGIPPAASILHLVADGLAAAAAVELVYSLFTSGPDEALDPLLLGLSAAALLSLGSVDHFDIGDGVTLILYALGLGVLFFIKKYLAEKTLTENKQKSLQNKPK